MSGPVSRLVCSGCGAEPPDDEPFPFRCPNAVRPDGCDHLLTRVFDPAAALAGGGGDAAAALSDGGGGDAAAAPAPKDARRFWEALFLSEEPQPFLRFRQLLHSYRAARAGGLSDADFCGMVTALDDAVAAVDGRGFKETPFAPAGTLSERLRLAGVGGLWIKDETGNVSGSHKGRHLFGVMLWLKVMQRLGRADGERPLAIASCGNAALAAAVVAGAAGRRLDVYIPADADGSVVEELRRLGARLTICPRQDGVPGDPSYLAFRRAVDEGALPFTCQGNENGLTIEGGMTLAWEMAATLRRRGERLDRIFVQVGGGALASATIQGLAEAHRMGLLDALPRLHAVQTEGGHPLERAWDLASERILRRIGGKSAAPAEERAALIARAPRAIVEAEMRYAATHRAEFMWPWETPPHSIASGILDDETYDWLAVLKGGLETGGHPIVVDEESLRAARDLAHETTDAPVSHTGAAGLAGCLSAGRSGRIGSGERIGVLFTGRER